jgi:hypothetical protein
MISLSPLAYAPPPRPNDEPAPKEKKKKKQKPPVDSEKSIDYHNEPTPGLYNHMRGAAIEGKYKLCQYIATILVRDRHEQPNMQLYNFLILSNVGYSEGAAFRVMDLLDEMEKDGLSPDVGTCHAALKALAVHVDHLLRADILHYMGERWIQLSEDGAHDVAAGLFREALFEQAVNRLDMMRQEGMHIQGWLLDMAVYVLCEAGEIPDAYRIMRQRVDSGELNISRSLWMFFLDKASEFRHHPAIQLAWSLQVEPKYINPSSGMCLNVMATAAEAADAKLATDIFTHLSKRGATFDPIHYEMLVDTYLATDPPDLERALSILTIMALEKVEPAASETRSLFLYMRDKPYLMSQAVEIFRDLREQGRKIPIAALNLIIECYVYQENLKDALKLYKQIHTFGPITSGAAKSFANIETFNLLLKGCREANPPDENTASFLVSELLALRVKPTALTYDRLILLFMRAGMNNIEEATKVESTKDAANKKKRGLELLDWSFRHFSEMLPLKWIPRLGTLEDLSKSLAKVGDKRCWDVLQVAEDHSAELPGWSITGRFVRKNVEEAWAGTTGEVSEQQLSRAQSAGHEMAEGRHVAQAA